MQSFDFWAIVYEGEVYCKECLPEDVDLNGVEVQPIFPGELWSSFPTCVVCGQRHDYVDVESLDDYFNNRVLKCRK